ncbi:hypothetical protein [Liquorilactobacillus sicerae]|uniref:hypothetical protein n=1 Tax=Liquorilactobacillus sicerae TaxID=1416943 RepID=UPI0024813580|nr:hypothetical protein [Liquorilactobacillus sicerae]
MKQSKIEFLDVTNLTVAHKFLKMELPEAAFSAYYQDKVLILTYPSALQREMIRLELRNDPDLFNFKVGDQYYGVVDLKEFQPSVLENDKTGYKLLATCFKLKEYDATLFLSSEFNEMGSFPVVNVRESDTEEFVEDGFLRADFIGKTNALKVMVEKQTNVLIINFFAYRRESRVFHAACYFEILDPESEDSDIVEKYNDYHEGASEYLEELKRQKDDDY